MALAWATRGRFSSVDAHSPTRRGTAGKIWRSLVRSLAFGPDDDDDDDDARRDGVPRARERDVRVDRVRVDRVRASRARRRVARVHRENAVGVSPPPRSSSRWSQPRTGPHTTAFAL